MAEIKVSPQDILPAMQRVADALLANADYLTELDQAVGDGDLGITSSNIARALQDAAGGPVDEDLGKFFMGTGMKVNSAASSSLGTLIATALMRAGKAVKGRTELDGPALVTMLHAADLGIQERGKTGPGQKTIIDAVHPAAAAFDEAITGGASLAEAARQALNAAEAGLEAVRPLRSKVGRAGWVGERTEGAIDPGCAFAVVVFKGLCGKA